MVSQPSRRRNETARMPEAQSLPQAISKVEVEDALMTTELHHVESTVLENFHSVLLRPRHFTSIRCLARVRVRDYLSTVLAFGRKCGYIHSGCKPSVTCSLMCSI